MFCVAESVFGERKAKKFQKENSFTMIRKIGSKNQEFLYFNTNNDTTIAKRLMSKTVNVNTKSIVDQSTKEENKIATPRDVLNDFLESTSVHGLQYFGKIDIKVGAVGKVLWTCAMLTGFVCLSLMVMQFLTRYRENPTNTFIKDFTAPIFKVPFPAVTICPLTPASMSKRLAILDSTILPANMSRELAMYFLKFGHQITLPYGLAIFNHTEKLELLLKTNKWTILDFLKMLHPCEDIYESCWWNNERVDCNKFIKFSHTSYGLCCSFNYVLEQYVGRDQQVFYLTEIRTVAGVCGVSNYQIPKFSIC
ncbi:sodium channel protein Nach-like [Megachile rotundata]|uniref:sodium channel protein Nach-like n=1 Tax=Megachile rotundata TaxID=143995 RepID=UPI003FD1F046